MTKFKPIGINLQGIVKSGNVVRHHSGRIYTILHLSNTHANDSDKFPVTVVYRGANGLVWSRPLSHFVDKFEIIFDGSQLLGGHYDEV